ncbi:MAG: acyl-CoA dehydrogenase family protein [Candidatus Binatia bacterium]|nr:acyl-CoA dehydrogenase family protein [Candidatus Binatia bacterium]
MVSFEPSEEQQLIRDTVAAFAREEVRPLARPSDETGEIPSALVQQGWELGLTQALIPEAYGGAGEAHSAVTSALVIEELAWADLSIACHLLAPRLLVVPVIEAGTEEQKRAILPRYTGTPFTAATAAVVEPRWDFDLASLAVTATPKNGSYILEGTKCFVPLAAEAEHLAVFARVADSSEVGVFLLERNTPGLRILEREKNMGLKGLATYEVAFEQCRIPAEQRLGGTAGCNVDRLLNLQRVALAAAAVGVARASFEYARDYAKERKAFGVYIAQKQAIAFMLAEMAIEIDAARLLTWEAAWKLDRGEDATREAVLAKQYAANMALMVADRGVQILGGHGYIRDHLVELFLRNARGFATFEGLLTA